ncbi:hypothetical protein RJT34_25212 [Clitoria ternatea]|uniref:Uncharacterized protein n=1 Tax=Clitoria ternatea TaxID=43366 RepID=A0AAN9IJU3_CLITE
MRDFLWNRVVRMIIVDGHMSWNYQPNRSLTLSTTHLRFLSARLAYDGIFRDEIGSWSGEFASNVGIGSTLGHCFHSGGGME